MLVYHGSTQIVESPRADFSRKRVDFGTGFYVTSNHDQALKWAKIKKERTGAPGCYVNVYDLPDDLMARGCLYAVSSAPIHPGWTSLSDAERQIKAIIMMLSKDQSLTITSTRPLCSMSQGTDQRGSHQAAEGPQALQSDSAPYG